MIIKICSEHMLTKNGVSVRNLNYSAHALIDTPLIDTFSLIDTL